MAVGQLSAGAVAAFRIAGSALGAQSVAMASVLVGYEFPGIIQVGNGVPYIGALNDGHSQQAPAGFVQRGINKALTIDLAGIAT